jgi:archaellum component FlaD/FlaE/tetrahydromethanopterin S-methyltransferase subunit G
MAISFLDSDDGDEEEESDNSDPDEDKYHEQIEETSNRLEEIESEMDDIRNTSDGLDNRQDAIEGRINSIEEKTENIEQNMEQLLGIYDAIASNVNPLFGDDLQSAIPDDIETEDISGNYELKESIADNTDDNSSSDFSLSDSDGHQEDDNNSNHSSNHEENHEEQDNHEEQENQASSSNPADKSSRVVLESTHKLDSVPRERNKEILTLRWIDYLVDSVGYRGAIECFDYYQEVGLVSPDATSMLISRLCMYRADAEKYSYDSIPTQVHKKSEEYIDKLSR